MSGDYQVAWRFGTKRFDVELQVWPENIPPEDILHSQECIDAVNNGDLGWFSMRVVVLLDGDLEVAYDSLGCCVYADEAEFYTAHRDPDPMNRNCTIMHAEKGEDIFIGHDFPDMVRGVVADARRYLSGLPRMRPST